MKIMVFHLTPLLHLTIVIFLTSLSLPHTLDNFGRLKVLSIECNYGATSWDADIPTWTVESLKNVCKNRQ